MATFHTLNNTSAAPGLRPDGRQTHPHGVKPGDPVYYRPSFFTSDWQPRILEGLGEQPHLFVVRNENTSSRYRVTQQNLSRRWEEDNEAYHVQDEHCERGTIGKIDLTSGTVKLLCNDAVTPVDAPFRFLYPRGASGFESEESEEEPIDCDPLVEEVQPTASPKEQVPTPMDKEDEELSAGLPSDGPVNSGSNQSDQSASLQDRTVAVENPEWLPNGWRVVKISRIIDPTKLDTYYVPMSDPTIRKYRSRGNVYRAIHNDPDRANKYSQDVLDAVEHYVHSEPARVTGKKRQIQNVDAEPLCEPEDAEYAIECWPPSEKEAEKARKKLADQKAKEAKEAKRLADKKAVQEAKKAVQEAKEAEKAKKLAKKEAEKEAKQKRLAAEKLADQQAVKDQKLAKKAKKDQLAAKQKIQRQKLPADILATLEEQPDAKNTLGVTRCTLNPEVTKQLKQYSNQGGLYFVDPRSDLNGAQVHVTNANGEPVAVINHKGTVDVVRFTGKDMTTGTRYKVKPDQLYHVHKPKEVFKSEAPAPAPAPALAPAPAPAPAPAQAPTPISATAPTSAPDQVADKEDIAAIDAEIDDLKSNSKETLRCQHTAQENFFKCRNALQLEISGLQSALEEKEHEFTERDREFKDSMEADRVKIRMLQQRRAELEKQEAERARLAEQEAERARLAEQEAERAANVTHVDSMQIDTEAPLKRRIQELEALLEQQQQQNARNERVKSEVQVKPEFSLGDTVKASGSDKAGRIIAICTKKFEAIIRFDDDSTRGPIPFGEISKC